MGNLIGLVGKMHSGKGEVAKRLVEQHGFIELSFADALKNASVDMLNAFYVSIGRNPTMTREILDRDKDQLRWLLQGVGTELGRQYVGPDTLWIDLVLQKIDYAFDNEPAPRIVVSDCRFQNEATALRRRGFEIVRIERPEEQRLESIRKKLFHEEMLRHVSSPFPEVAFDVPARLIEEVNRSVYEKLEATRFHPSEHEILAIRQDYTLENKLLVALDAIVERMV